MTWAILPMKVPGEGKTRLETDLEVADRAALADAMFRDVLAAAETAAAIERVVIVSSRSVAEAAGIQEDCWLDDSAAENHSEAAGIGIRAALAAGCARVMLLPGDCPGITASELDDTLARGLPPVCVGVIPDRHGQGTNGLILSPPDAIEPSFGPDSHARHLRLAADARLPGVTVPVQGFAHDIDTHDDLDVFRNWVEARPHAAPLTREVLAHIEAVRNG